MKMFAKPTYEELEQRVRVLEQVDIERAQAEDSLRLERDLSQRYLDTVQTTMVAMDMEGRITMINRAGCGLLGYAEGDLLGRNWFATCLCRSPKVWPVSILSSSASWRATCHRPSIMKTASYAGTEPSA